MDFTTTHSMTKMAKQPEDTSWEGQWAQAVVRSLRQLEGPAEGLATPDDEREERLAQVDEELVRQVVEGLSRPLDTFHGALNRLGDELSRNGLERAYDRFASYLNEAAQTMQWERETPTPVGPRFEGGRTSLFGLGLLLLISGPEMAQQWSPATNEALAAMLVQHRHVAATGRLVLLPVGLNIQETVDFEPWMGYRLTGLLAHWADEHPQGHPSVDEALELLAAAGVCPTAQALPSAGTAGAARSKYLRQLTLLGLHIAQAESLFEPESDDLQDSLEYDFPQANFAAGLTAAQRDLEHVLLALALRQGSSTLGANPEQAKATSERFAAWSLSDLQDEATGLSAELDGLRAAHPDLAAAQAVQGFGSSDFAQAVSAALAPEVIPAGESLEAQPAWPTTFAFEATDEGLKAYRDLSFRARVSLATGRAGLQEPSGLQAVIDHDLHKREFQVLLQPHGQSQVAGYAAWAVLPWESIDEALADLRDTLASLGVGAARTGQVSPVVLH